MHSTATVSTWTWRTLLVKKSSYNRVQVEREDLFIISVVGTSRTETLERYQRRHFYFAHQCMHTRALRSSKRAATGGKKKTYSKYSRSVNFPSCSYLTRPVILRSGECVRPSRAIHFALYKCVVRYLRDVLLDEEFFNYIDEESSNLRSGIRLCGARTRIKLTQGLLRSGRHHIRNTSGPRPFSLPRDVYPYDSAFISRVTSGLFHDQTLN